MDLFEALLLLTLFITSNQLKVVYLFFDAAILQMIIIIIILYVIIIINKKKVNMKKITLIVGLVAYFSGFVFKIHANMDPNHRDRLAFIKIVSGTFKRNTPYYHVRHKKRLKFSTPNAFFAEKKEIVDISFPGDIVGLHDTGNFKIGDTLTAGEVVNYKGNLTFDHSQPDGNPRKLLDSGIINQLGWKSKVSLERGLIKTYDWYMSNRDKIKT